MNTWNIRSLWCRCFVLTMAMVVTVMLLSGCGKKQESRVENAVGVVQKQEMQSKNTELSSKYDTVALVIDKLTKQVQRSDFATAEQTVSQLGKYLDEVSEQTENWLEAQDNVKKSLSSKTKRIFEERQAEFQEQITSQEKNAKQLLAEATGLLEQGKQAEAKKKVKEVRSLLVKEEEPETYGSHIPNQSKVIEPEVKTVTSLSQKHAKAKVKVADETDAALLEMTGDTQLNGEIKKKADELKTPLKVYNYLKTHLGYEYYFGSRKGAIETYESNAGNDIDQANLFVAMLRYLGYPCMYVKGNIYLTKEQAMSMTGSDSYRHAAEVLSASGTPVKCMNQDGTMIQLQMEHTWVRAYVPYTDYRGAGHAKGDSVWLDLDTGIKEYKDAENIYHTLDDMGISELSENYGKTGNVNQYQESVEQLVETLKSKDLSNTYARKRIINTKELRYLPLSLQYEVQEERESFAKIPKSQKDRIEFAINDEMLVSNTTSELYNKDIVLAFQPATEEDEEIYHSYSSMFDVPAYQVTMKPVLLLNHKVVAEGSEETWLKLGEKATFTLNITSGDETESVKNDVKAGSMYAVTLDNQIITSSELEKVYNKYTTLKDTATKENVFTEEYLGTMLALSGKLYFAQLDVADIIAADMQEVSSTRGVSEGITGYEVRTQSIYGTITRVLAGSLYIDIDKDVHGVVSLKGKQSDARQYMQTTGMIGSSYEAIIWEQMTGKKSVSTISILAKAEEDRIERLVIGKPNLLEAIEQLEATDGVKKDIKEAVQKGNLIIVPAKPVTMNAWTGTGYISINPETGAGAYMISGGLNGGCVGNIDDYVELAYYLGMAVSNLKLNMSFKTIASQTELLLTGEILGNRYLEIGALANIYASVKTIKSTCFDYSEWTELYFDYIITEDEKKGIDLIQKVYDSINGVVKIAPDGFFGSTIWSAIYDVASIIERL